MGELSDEEVEKLITIMANPRQYKIPDWFLNRQKDIKDGKFSQVTSNQLENKLREGLERLKKIRAHRGLRHYLSLRVRGQHTKTTGRRGRTLVSPRRREANFPIPLNDDDGLLLGGSCRSASISSSSSRSAPFFSPLSFFVMNRLVSLFRSKD